MLKLQKKHVAAMLKLQKKHVAAMLTAVLVIVMLATATAQDDDSCWNAPSRTREGYCITIHSCPPILKMLKQKPPRPQTIKQLRDTQCGFQGSVPLVCCPLDSATSGGDRVVVETTTAASRLSTTTASRLKTTTASRLRTTTTTTTTTTKLTGTQQTPLLVELNHPKIHLLQVNECGSGDPPDRIVNGKEAMLGQFPWMARIGYATRSGESFRCGGSLINKRYVLTAAHCVTSLPQNFRLKSVVLGEWDTETEPDCDKKTDFCMPNTQVFNVEHSIPHPQYNTSTFHHDIALIRLDRDADLSVDNVRTVCLPVGRNQLKNLDQAEFFIVAGWGTTENGTSSTKLLYVDVGPVTLDGCRSIYQRQASIVPSQLCAGGSTQDSCEGDSGGPLTMQDQVTDVPESPRTVQIGVVSFGPRKCGTLNMPGVYTRVGHYMNWIMDTIKD